MPRKARPPPRRPIESDKHSKNIKEFQHDKPPSLTDSFGDILSRSNIEFRHTVETDPRKIQDRGELAHDLDHRVGGRTLRASKSWNLGGNGVDLLSLLREQHAVVIGGAIVRHISLVVSEAPGNSSRFGDLPVKPLQDPEGTKACLLSQQLELGQADIPILIFPEPFIAPPNLGTSYSLRSRGYDHTAVMSETPFHITTPGMTMSELQVYTISGDITDFWGIRGLTAKMYKHKGSGTLNEPLGDKPAQEKVSINVHNIALGGKPMAAFFPFIDSEEFKNLPVANVELTYSEGKTQSPVQKPGLRLELDVELSGCLSWVGDTIKRLFGTIDKPPTIRLSALLSKERNWSCPPKIERLVLQGYFKDLAFKSWNVLRFETLGIELTAVKTGNSWDFGFGFLGEVALLGVPEAQAPPKLSYRIAREIDEPGDNSSRSWTLAIDVPDWKGFFGFENINIQATLMASIDEEHFSSSVSLEVEGKILIGEIRWKFYGRFLKGWMHALTWTWIAIESQKGVPLRIEDYYIRASLGDLKLSDIKGLYAQITGQNVSNETHDSGSFENEISFKNMSLCIACTKYSDPKQNQKTLHVSGEVTVGDTTSYSASLTFSPEGVTVTGDVSDFQIPGTDIFIEKARLRGFLNFKGGKKQHERAFRTGKQHITLQRGEPDSATGSAFSILGVIHYHKATFSAGLHLAKQKNLEWEWLVFGSSEHLRLRDIWPSIDETSFLNIQLEHVSVIASSGDKSHITRPRQTQSKNESKEYGGPQVTQGHIDSGNDNSDEAHAHWDVLAEIEHSGYTIKEGFQICAVISSFQQLEHLNHGKKFERLQLCFHVDKQGRISASIQLPPSFKVELSPIAHFSEFSVSLCTNANYGMCLELHATLTLMLEHSDPVQVQGVVIGTISGASGCLLMKPDTRWVNPFNLNRELMVSNLGIEAGFEYATVFELGPTHFALKGNISVGRYEFDLNVGVDVTKAAAVLRTNASKLDVSDIVMIASILCQSEKLAKIADQITGVVVFSDLGIYFSSGATFLGEYYPRGIQVRGKMTFFDKHGEFYGSLTDDGAVIKGGLDAFKVGGLEITSLKEYNGKKRATLEVEVTELTQKLLVDGIIRFYDIELQVYINANMQERFLELSIRIKLTDALVFTLHGEARVNGFESLEGTTVSFEGHLEAKIIETIADGICKSITALEDQAKQAIDMAATSINVRLATLNDKLAAQKRDLEILRLESTAEMLNKREQITKENELLRELYNKIDEYDKIYQEAKLKKNIKDAQVQEQMKKRDEAKSQLDEKKREMRQEYDRKIANLRSRQTHYKSERDRLQQKKDANWGDVLRRGMAAAHYWQEWCEKERYEWKCTCEKNIKSCHWWETPYWSWKLSEATLGLEQAHASKAVETEVRHATEAIINSDEFRAVESGINNAIFEMERFDRALGKLFDQGPMGYIEEMAHDEREDLARQIALYDKLVQESRKLELALIAARDALEAEKGRLKPKQEAARLRIAVLEMEIKLRPFESDYQAKKQEFDRVKTQADALRSTLDDIKKGVHVGADVVRQVTRMVQAGIPEIKNIDVKASSDTIAQNRPITFDITVKWLEQDHTCCVEWSPNQEAHELYGSAAKRIVGLVDELG
ncbi:hypothetical protein ABHI18_012444 [Aspergillus niger]